MRRLLLFLLRHRAFLLFLFLEIICGWLIVQNNSYQSATFFNSSNSIAANILSVSNDVTSYFSLRTENKDLAQEIARLQAKLDEKPKEVILVDSTTNIAEIDTLEESRYEFQTAEVINNSTRRFNNYLTIDKGSVDGVLPNMGVVGGGGVVGKIKYTSNHYSVVTSLLHADFYISSKVKDKINLCSTKWDHLDPSYASLLFVPKHINLQVGDTVVTSGFNSIYPEDVPIGVVSTVQIPEEATFFNAKIKLVNDFSRLSYVHIVQNLMRNEKDSLESLIQPENE